MVRHPRLAALFLTVAAFVSHALAQNKEQTINPQSSCSRDNALSLIQRQIDLAKTIDSDAKRIVLTLRAADLMWPADQPKARATFSDAFDVATRLFKEKGAPDSSFGRAGVQGIDYRYTVITAVGKRDSAWARKLSQQILDEEAEAAKQNAQAANEKAQQTAQASQIGGSLRSVAVGLLVSDQQAALQFARTSLRYPASISLSTFLFKLWETNHTLADQFYAEALNAYANAPMDQFLYLSSYPFAANREIGEMPVWMSYSVPIGLRSCFSRNG